MFAITRLIDNEFQPIMTTVRERADMTVLMSGISSRVKRKRTQKTT